MYVTIEYSKSFNMCFKFSSTLVCQIDMQNEINVQVENFLKGIKRINVNMQDRIDMQGEFFFSKSINVQTKIRPCRGEFFLRINKRACTSIRYTSVDMKNVVKFS